MVDYFGSPLSVAAIGGYCLGESRLPLVVFRYT